MDTKLKLNFGCYFVPNFVISCFLTSSLTVFWLYSVLCLSELPV